MSESDLLRHCAPTLAGIKTGSIFVAGFDSYVQFLADLLELNSILNPKGIEVRPLRVKDGRALIYVYRASSLKNDLSDGGVAGILRDIGYDVGDHNISLSLLSDRLRGSEEFPHEIGVFLGYPAEDVAGFIKNNAKNSKMQGLWKVYGDVEMASELFRRFTKCTEVYLKCWQRGVPLTKLTVNMA